MILMSENSMTDSQSELARSFSESFFTMFQITTSNNFGALFLLSEIFHMSNTIYGGH